VGPTGGPRCPRQAAIGSRYPQSGSIEVGQSFQDPAIFFETNVGGSIALLSAALKAGVHKVGFHKRSYGIPQGPLREDSSQSPVNL
jgi:UDP-glucose 4-epimerase